MRIPIAIVGHATSQRTLQAFVDATTLVDRAMVREGNYEPLYTSGIRYRNELRGGAFPGVERFQTLSSSHEVGYDDCDGLAPARAAELLEQGVPARAYAIRSPGVGWHVVVLRRDARGRTYVEDPSARLGMLEPREQPMPRRNPQAIDPDEVEVLGVHATHRGRCVAAVGAIAPDGSIYTAVGAADVDPDAPPRSGNRRARARAAQGAFAALARRATSVYIAPARAVSQAARGAAASVATRANRARADSETLERLDVDDAPEGDDVEGFDPWAWRMYELR